MSFFGFGGGETEALKENEEHDQGTKPMACVRLTLLGAADCGKTSLINSWVSNFCPTTYVPTEDAQLYYRAMRIPCPGDEEEPMTVLVELEDTYSWSRSEGKDGYGQPYNASVFLENAGKSSSGFFGPGTAKLMSGSEAPSRTKHSPITPGRMGFLVLFDSNSRDSLAAAKDICKRLLEQRAKSGSFFCISLVGNKIDKDPFDTTFLDIMEQARSYAASRKLPLVEVSALEFTRVRKLFRDMIEEIVAEEQKQESKSSAPILPNLGWVGFGW